MARVICGDCAGDGLSRDLFWKRCWRCCGRGDYPETAADVLPSDIGMGVGMAIEYDPKTGDRKHFVLTGVRDGPVLARAPARGDLPYALGGEIAFACELLQRWQAGAAICCVWCDQPLAASEEDFCDRCHATLGVTVLSRH